MTASGASRPEADQPRSDRRQPGRPQPGRPQPGRPQPGRPQPGRPQPDPDTAAVIAEWAGEQLTDRMGIRVTEWDPERVVGTVPVTGNRQPFGLLHGGANAVLAETLGSTAAALWAMPDRIPLGLELSCAHHRAATEGEVTGICTPLHRGRSTVSFEIVLHDEQGRRTCTARLTCLLRERPPG